MILARVSRLLLVAFVILLARGAAGAEEPADYAFLQHPGAAVPRDLAFREADGRAIRFGDLLGRRPLILALGYFRCPTLCSVVRDDLFDALSGAGLRAGADYDLAVASIDPAETSRDAAAAKTEEAARHSAAAGREGGAGWHFLVGNEGAIAALADAVGFRSRYDVALRQFLHPAGIVILTAGGRVSSYVLGVGYRAGDVRTAVTVASSGGIAEAAVPLMLLCFNLDAATGRYTLAVMKVLRLAGVVLLAVAGTALLLAFRRERRKAEA